MSFHSVRIAPQAIRRLTARHLFLVFVLPLILVVSSPIRAQASTSGGSMSSTHYVLVPVLGGAATVTSQSAHFSLNGGVGLVSPSTTKLLLGDLNDDGLVSVSDVIIALKISLKLISPTPYQLSVGDLLPRQSDGTRGDGYITITDVTALLSSVVGNSTL